MGGSFAEGKKKRRGVEKRGKGEGGKAGKKEKKWWNMGERHEKELF